MVSKKRQRQQERKARYASVAGGTQGASNPMTILHSHGQTLRALMHHVEDLTRNNQLLQKMVEDLTMRASLLSPSSTWAKMTPKVHDVGFLSVLLTHLVAEFGKLPKDEKSEEDTTEGLLHTLRRAWNQLLWKRSETTEEAMTGRGFKEGVMYIEVMCLDYPHSLVLSVGANALGVEGAKEGVDEIVGDDAPVTGVAYFSHNATEEEVAREKGAPRVERLWLRLMFTDKRALEETLQWCTYTPAGLSYRVMHGTVLVEKYPDTPPVSVISQMLVGMIESREERDTQIEERHTHSDSCGHDHDHDHDHECHHHDHDHDHETPLEDCQGERPPLEEEAEEDREEVLRQYGLPSNVRVFKG